MEEINEDFKILLPTFRCFVKLFNTKYMTVKNCLPLSTLFINFLTFYK